MASNAEKALAIVSTLKQYGVVLSMAKENALFKTVEYKLSKGASSADIAQYVLNRLPVKNAFAKAYFNLENAKEVRAELLSKIGSAAASGVDPSAPVYSLSADKTTVDEGGLVNFTLSTVNVAAGTPLSYVLSGVNAADVAGGSLTGTVTVGSDGKAIIPVVLLADMATEGAETLGVSIVGKTASVAVNDTSKAPVPTTMAASANSMTEGAAGVTYTVNGEAGKTYFWAVDGAHAADVSTNAGAVTLDANGVGTFQIAAVKDGLSEGNEVAVVTLTSTASQAVATSSTLIVDDAADARVVELKGSASSATEGQAAITYTVTNGQPNASYTWTVDAGHVNDVTVTSGVVTLDANGSGSFQVAAKQDNTSESAEVVTVSLINSTTAAVVASAGFTALDDPNIGQTYTLSGGIDKIAGGAGGDTIQSPSFTSGLTGLDLIDGGAGSDALSIFDVAAIAIPASATVLNVEKADFLSSGTVTGDTSSWTGLTELNVVKSTGTTLTAGATTAVNVSGTTGAVSVTGGSAANVTAAGAVTLAGSATQTVASQGGFTLAGATGAVKVADSALAAAAGSVNGGSNVEISVAGQTTGTITVGGTAAPSGTVSVTSTSGYASAGNADLTMGAIAVTGGTTVSVTQSAASEAQKTAAKNDTTQNTVTQAAVNVTGGAATTEVSVKQDSFAGFVNATTATAGDGVLGVNSGAVTITDANAASATAAGTIATVSLNGYGASAVDSSALATLNLAGVGGALNIGRGNLTAVPTANTLTVNAAGLRSGVITDAEAAAGDDGFTTLNVATSGSASTVAGINAIDLTALNVSGDQGLTLTAANGMTALKTVAVSGSAGLTADFSGIATVTSVTSTSTGSNNLTVAPTATTVTTGAGNDSVTFTGAIAATGKVDLGAGNDSLVLAGASTAGASINAGEGTDTLKPADVDNVNGSVAYNGFEVVDISGDAGGTLDMSKLAGAASIIASAPFAGVAATNVAAGTTVSFSNTAAALNTTGILGYALKTDTASDALTINLTTVDDVAKAAATKGDNSVNGINVAGIIADGVETLTVKTSVTNVDGGIVGGVAHVASDYVETISSLSSVAVTSGTPAVTTPGLTTLVYTGNASLTVGSGAWTLNLPNLSKVDASAATGAMAIDLSAASATKAVTFLGGSAGDTYVATPNGDLVVGAAGADAITLNAGKDTVRYTSAGDSVLGLKDTSAPADGKADVVTGIDTVAGFTIGSDKIELSSSLGLSTGDARTAITQKGDIATASAGTTAQDLQTVIGAGTGFFNDGSVNRATAFASDSATGNGYLFVDVNHDGNFTAANDLAIQLTGVAALDVNSITFG